QGALDEAKLALTTIGQMLADRQESAMQHQARLQGVRERALLLAQLEEQQEGIGRGAKRLLEMAAQEAVAPWNSVKGLVADLIEIDVHLAPLIDVALGAAAETVVLEDGQIIDLIRHGTLNLDGRVSLMRMDRLPSRRSGEKIQLDGLRGVLGRADRLVHVEPEYAALLHYLLGTTWLVDSLSTALDLSHLRGAGLRFVTAA
ncbi:MAG: chromosome segregation protein SMC, partial [Pirellulaceae bacterium]